MVVQDEQGLLFSPETEIASLTPEFRGRWRIVLSDGTVANCPTPPPPGPWVPHGKYLLAPRHMVATEQGWRDPAGFLYPPGKLPAPPEVERWPPVVPELPCHPDRVISLIGHGRTCHWHTDDGDIDWPIPATRAAAAHPSLFKLAKGIFLNQPRLRRILKVNRTVSPYLFVMNSGDRYELDGASLKEVCQRLGLTNLTCLEPHDPGLARYDLRDYPYQLSNAKRDRLRADFRNRKHLMANMIWQTLRWRQEGVVHKYSTSLRDLWYDDVKHTIYRGGWLSRSDDEDRAWKELKEIARQLIGDYRLFTYVEIGYKDENPHSRVIGKTRPGIVLHAEKGSLSDQAFALAAEFGLSCQITGGMPTLMNSEFLARALQEVVHGPIQVIGYVDYDPGGWAIADTLANHLAKFGLPEVQPVQFLVRAEDFTPEEIELFSMPCAMGTPSLATVAKQWLKRSGGINGELMTISANKLEPYERVRDCLIRLLG